MNLGTKISVIKEFFNITYYYIGGELREKNMHFPLSMNFSSSLFGIIPVPNESSIDRIICPLAKQCTVAPTYTTTPGI